MKSFHEQLEEHEGKDAERFAKIEEHLSSIDSKLDPIYKFFTEGRSYTKVFLSLLLLFPFLASILTGMGTIWHFLSANFLHR